MRKSFLNIFAIIIFLATISNAQSPKLSGYVRNYTGVLLNNDNNYAIIQNTVNLNIEQNKDKVAFKANPYIYQYPNEDIQIGLREAYMDIYLNSVDLRIGKQQIIWGKADGVFITDIISPKNLSEFLLPDFDEIRMGITALKADYYLGDNTFEVVWSPSFKPTHMPDKNSIWFPKLNFPVPPVFNNPKTIESNLENSDFFAKYSAMTSLIDFEIMGGYAWDDDPSMHITKAMSPQGINITVNPKYHRLTIAGGSFSTTLGPLVLRSEGAYYAGKYFNTEDPKATDALVEKDYLHYLIGLDYTLWDIKLSTQFIQQAILDYDDAINQDEYENTLTFVARRNFLRETLALELFSYVGINNEDALIKPKISYDLTDGLKLTTGANFFVGDKGKFGQYDDNDMAYTKIKYSF